MTYTDTLMVCGGVDAGGDLGERGECGIVLVPLQNVPFLIVPQQTCFVRQMNTALPPMLWLKVVNNGLFFTFLFGRFPCHIRRTTPNCGVHLMGRLPGNNRKYEIKTLQERHREILRRLALGQGSKDIASSLSITPQVVHYVKNSQIGKRELNLIQGARTADAVEVSNQIQELAPQALETLDAIMLDEESPDTIKVKIAIDLLDRAGHGAVKKNLNVNQQLTQKDLEDIKIRAKEVARVNGSIIEEVPN